MISGAEMQCLKNIGFEHIVTFRETLGPISFQSTFQQIHEHLHPRDVDYWKMNTLLNLVVFLVFREFGVAELAYGKLALRNLVFKCLFIDFSA